MQEKRCPREAEVKLFCAFLGSRQGKMAARGHPPARKQESGVGTRPGEPLGATVIIFFGILTTESEFAFLIIISYCSPAISIELRFITRLQGGKQGICNH